MSYGELVGDKPFDIKFTGTAPRKPPSQYKLVGTRVPRVDMPAKVDGTYTHMQHVRVANMLHGRVVRPRGQRAYGTRAAPLAIDEGSIKDIPGAQIVRRGDFVGVVAESEWDAVRAAQQLEVRWQDTPSLPDMTKLAGDAARHEVHRYRCGEYRRSGGGLWQGYLRVVGDLLFPVPGPRAVRSELRDRGCRV